MSEPAGFKASARSVKQRLVEELKDKEPASESSADYGDFDPNDWGRTQSEDARQAAEGDDAEAPRESSELTFPSDVGQLDLDDLEADAALESADLEDIDLEDDLDAVDLDDPSLDDDLDLDSADLIASADLESADLESADLESADLESADLESALESADLESEDLESASEELTSSDQALLDKIRSGEDGAQAPLGDDWGRTASDDALLEEVDPAELSWPDELTPGTRPTRPGSGRSVPPGATPAPPGAQAKPADPPAAATAAVRQELSSRSRDTTLMQLAKQGIKNVKVLGMSAVERIVERAVATAIERSAVERSEGERKQLEQDARKEFFKLFKRHKQALAEGVQERAALASQVEELRAELGKAESALAHEQRGSTPNLGAEAVAQLEASFKQLLSGFMTEERRQLVSTDDPLALKGLSDLEKKMSAVFDRLLDRVKSHTEELLERRIGKLNAALEETESALRQLALSKGFDDGIASIYASIQGLEVGDLDYQRKKELLSIVFVENLQIQNRELTEDDRKAYSDALAALGNPEERKVEPTLNAPSGFAAPVDVSDLDVAF